MHERSKKTAVDNPEIRKIQLLNHINDLHLQLKTLKKKRHIYLAQLRYIEILCQKFRTHGPNPLAERILGILHATTDGFAAPDENPHYSNQY